MTRPALTLSLLTACAPSAPSAPSPAPTPAPIPCVIAAEGERLAYVIGWSACHSDNHCMEVNSSALGCDAVAVYRLAAPRGAR